MAENLAYPHIKVTQQTRVNGLGSSGQCAQSEQYWRTETTETDPPEHTALLRCLAGTGAGRHAALRQLAHSSHTRASCHCFTPPCTAHCCWSPLPCGSSISRQLGSRAECEPDQVSCSGPTTDTGTRHRPAAFTAGPGSGTGAAGPAAGPVTLPCYGWI